MTDYSAQAHFGDYWPPDFGWGGSHDPEAHSDQLAPFSFDGVTFGQCHRDVHSVFTAILTELVPHIPGGLHAGSCWAYSTTDNLPDDTRSFHSFAIAMDVNWNVNHMGNNLPDPTGQYAIPRGPATAIARKYGCEWGGNWTGGFHDLMHFECHLTPDVARTVRPGGSSNEGDWFDMATEKDLEAAVRKVLAEGVTVTKFQDITHALTPSPENCFMGIPGYRTVSWREQHAKRRSIFRRRSR